MRESDIRDRNPVIYPNVNVEQWYNRLMTHKEPRLNHPALVSSIDLP